MCRGVGVCCGREDFRSGWCGEGSAGGLLVLAPGLGGGGSGSGPGDWPIAAGAEGPRIRVEAAYGGRGGGGSCGGARCGVNREDAAVERGVWVVQ